MSILDGHHVPPQTVQGSFFLKFYLSAGPHSLSSVPLLQQVGTAARIWLTNWCHWTEEQYYGCFWHANKARVTKEYLLTTHTLLWLDLKKVKKKKSEHSNLCKASYGAQGATRVTGPERPGQRRQQLAGLSYPDAPRTAAQPGQAQSSCGRARAAPGAAEPLTGAARSGPPPPRPPPPARAARASRAR